MGFLEQEDFELLSKWGNQPYDKNNSEHQEALRKLGEVYQKIKDIGEFIIIKTPKKGWSNQRFKEYNWGRFHPTDDKRLCLAIGMYKGENYFVKIDIVHSNKDLTKEQKDTFEKLREETIKGE